jgi:hypothetical protein
VAKPLFDVMRGDPSVPTASWSRLEIGVYGFAVNGRVAGTTWSYSFEGDVRFAALVPPAVFRRGANQVRVFRRAR